MHRVIVFVTGVATGVVGFLVFSSFTISQNVINLFLVVATIIGPLLSVFVASSILVEDTRRRMSVEREYNVKLKLLDRLDKLEALFCEVDELHMPDDFEIKVFKLVKKTKELGATLILSRKELKELFHQVDYIEQLVSEQKINPEKHSVYIGKIKEAQQDLNRGLAVLENEVSVL